MVPSHQRAPMRIRWTPEQSGESLVIDYGTDKVVRDHAMPETRTSPAMLRVFTDDGELGQKLIEPIPGWHRWRLDELGVGEIT